MYWNKNVGIEMSHKGLILSNLTPAPDISLLLSIYL